MATKVKTKKSASKIVKKTKLSESTEVSAKPKEEPVKTKHNKKALFIIGGIFVFLLGIFVAKNFLIAATVNGQPITRITVIKELEKQGGQQTLEGLITRALIRQEAEKRNLSITTEEIEAEIARINETLKEQQTTLEQALELQGMTREDLNNDIRLQLLVQKLVEDRVEVTDEEVKEYLTQNQDFFPEDANQEENLKNAREQLRQQKISAETQRLIEELQKNANTVFFVNY